MRKSLLATTALAAAGAFAVGTASASDRMSVGVGGYMEQWFGMASVDNGTDNDGGISQWSDSEIYFRGRLEADNGLTFSVKVEMEGNTNTTDQIDESQATVSGSFGQVVLGSEDHPASIMHYGNQDVGVGLSCGDPSWVAGVTSCAREGGKGLGTSGWIVGGDDQKIAYYTPRLAGMQFGAAYIPDANTEDGNRAPTNNDNDAWSVGLNYRGNMGDASVGVSFGHYQRNQVGGMLMSPDESAALAVPVANAGMIEDRISKRRGQFDAETFTNFGLQIGFGAFGFDVAYATHDGGEYMAADNPDASDIFAADAVSVVKNTSKDYDVTSAGMMYSDGPMSASLSHMMADADDGGEASTTMLSFRYGLAPGIASRTSLMFGEQDDVDGTAFVTGIRIDF